MAFNGTWKIDHNENYDKFMEQMGINLMKRKLAEHDNLKLVIEQKGTAFVVKESSRFRTKDIEFTLGVEFEYSLADGTELSGTWEMDGDSVMKGNFTRKDNGKALIATRTFEGEDMVMKYSYEGVDAKRFFKKA